MIVSNGAGRWLARSFVLLAFALVVLSAVAAGAQTAPKIERLFPAGAQRGSTVDVELGAEYLPGVGQLSAAGAGLIVEPTDAPNRFRFTIAADAPLGPRELRLSTVQGASAPFPFFVGDLPETTHPGDSEPLELKLPSTVNGRLAASGAIHRYAVTLAAGQQLIAAATVRPLRSPVDPMLRLLDADGRQVAVGVGHRSAESLLVHRSAGAGRFTLEVYDFQLAGGAEHIYRMTATVGPWLDYAWPPGVARDAATALVVYGWNLPSPAGDTLEISVPPQSGERYELTLPGAANRLTLPVGADAEARESEPNDSAEQANSPPFPATIFGRLETPGDVDFFAFTAKKTQKLALDVDSAELDFPGDPVLAVVNEAGKTLVEADDAKASRDPSLRFTAPADGRYFVSIRDRSGGGGRQFVYRLRLSAPRPDFSARVNVASLMLHAGKSIKLPVIVDRIDGLADELELTAVDLPTGVTVEPQPIPAKTPATLQLSLVIAADAAPVGGLARIVVRGTKTEPRLERTAVVAEAAAAAGGSDRIWLAVCPEIPFTLKTTTTILDAPRMAGFPFPVSVVRNEGFVGPIRLVGVEPDRRGTLKPLTGQIESGIDSGSIPLVIQHQVTEGTTHRSRVMGVADVKGVDGKTYEVFHVAPGAMSVGCQPSLLTLTASPAMVELGPGETQRIEVQLMRRTTMAPILLRLDPPSDVRGIECEPVEVAVGQTQATLTLRLAPDARLPPRVMIPIAAESSRDGLPIYGRSQVRLERK